MSLMQIKQTPLADSHRRLGARMVDFAGWDMPVQYQSIIAEHKSVRNAVGLFDVSHMGEFTVSGESAKAFLQFMIANDLEKLDRPNTALYTQFLNDSGGTVDDLIIYRRLDDYLLVVNASNISKDWQWLQTHASNFSDVQLIDISDQTALLSLQGPRAALLLADVAHQGISDLLPFSCTNASIAGIPTFLTRTGYTGEDGFEIFVSPDDVERLWSFLLQSGSSYAIEPCGLGARDTLRLEAALPLYGHELDEQTSPLEAGLGWSVKPSKKDFLGKEALQERLSEGFAKQCVCLTCEGKALPRQGYTVLAGDAAIGIVTSGSQGISVGYPIAMAYVPPAYTSIGQHLFVAIRDASVRCEVVARPFYKRARS